MKALLLDAPGPPETLRLGEAQAPHAGPGEIVVRVKACGLNPVDYRVAQSGNPAWTWPHILGLDVAGVVEEVGQDVSGFVPGDKVAYHGDLRRNGGYAEFAVTAADTVAPMPQGLSFERAAALPCAGMTAYQAINRRLHLHAGDTILVTGGAGGVGGFAIQLARSRQARVFTTASPANLMYVGRLGADIVFDYHTDDVPTSVRELTNGYGVDGVIDTIGPDSARDNLELVAYGGGLVAVAGRPETNPVRPFTTSPSVHEISLGAAHAYGNPAARKDLVTMLTAIMRRVANGTLDAMLTETVSLADVPAALAHLATRHARGKTVYVAD